MRLADFSSANSEAILLQWDAFARSVSQGSAMDGLALRNNAADILLATTDDMRTAQSAAERSDKSKGHEHCRDL